MGIVYADVRLGNDARPELEEIDATALVDTGALHLCIPEHVALQLRLSQKQPREVQTADGRSHLVPYVSPVKVSLPSSCINIHADRQEGRRRQGCSKFVALRWTSPPVMSSL